jgi:hypothetical protein
MENERRGCSMCEHLQENSRESAVSKGKKKKERKLKNERKKKPPPRTIEILFREQNMQTCPFLQQRCQTPFTQKVTAI